MIDNKHKDPLHGVTLEMILTYLVEKYGWEEMSRRIRINCFAKNPSIKSSLVFLRRTPWARKKVENLYIGKKVKQKIFSLIMLILSLTIYASAAQDLDVINFKFGIVSITPKDGFMVSKETAAIPNKEGVMYGFAYDFFKRKNTPIRETVELQLPSTNNENTAIVSDSLIEDASGIQNFGLKIDKGDPSGKFAIIIQHDNVVFKRIEYVVE